MTSRECARARAAIDDLATLDRAAARALQDHAAACPDCARRLGDARRVNAFVRGLAPVPPPADLLPRLLDVPRRAPAPATPWLRLAPAVAALALLGALALQGRGGELAAPPVAPSAATTSLGAVPTTVARRGTLGLVTPRTASAAEPTGAPAVADAGPAEGMEPVLVPRLLPTEAASPAPAPTEAPPAAPDRPRRPPVVDEPTPAACGSIVVRVFTDVAGADGTACAACDGRLTDEDLAVAQALALALPPLQLSLRAGEGASEVTVHERAIERAGPMHAEVFEIPCSVQGPFAVVLAGDLGPWAPCASSAGVRQVVDVGGSREAEFPLTTACVAPTPTSAPTETAVATEPVAAATPDAPLGSGSADPAATPERGPDRP